MKGFAQSLRGGEPEGGDDLFGGIPKEMKMVFNTSFAFGGLDMISSVTNEFNMSPLSGPGLLGNVLGGGGDDGPGLMSSVLGGGDDDGPGISSLMKGPAMKMLGGFGL